MHIPMYLYYAFKLLLCIIAISGKCLLPFGSASIICNTTMRLLNDLGHYCWMLSFIPNWNVSLSRAPRRLPLNHDYDDGDVWARRTLLIIIIVINKRQISKQLTLQPAKRRRQDQVQAQLEFGECRRVAIIELGHPNQLIELSCERASWDDWSGRSWATTFVD